MPSTADLAAPVPRPAPSLVRADLPGGGRAGFPVHVHAAAVRAVGERLQERGRHLSAAGLYARVVRQRLGERRLPQRLHRLDPDRCCSRCWRASRSAFRRASRWCAAASRDARRSTRFLLSPLIVPGIVAGTAIYIYFVQLELWTGVRVIATLPGFVAGACGADDSLDGAARLGEPRRRRPARSRRRRPISARGRSPPSCRVTLPMIRPGVVAAGDLLVHRLVHRSRDVAVPGRAGPLDPADRACCSISNGSSIRPSPQSRSCRSSSSGSASLVTDRFVKLSKVV